LQTRVARVTPAMATVLALALVVTTWTAVGGDRAQDGTALLVDLPWAATAAVFLLFGLVAVHYVSAALALRAVSNHRVSLGPTLLVQFVAAATDRVVPNGIGAAGVNLRYLLRSGMDPGAAASSLGALAIVGGVTDLAYGAGVSTVGPALGLAGAAHELHTLASHGLGAGQKHYWVLVAVAVAVLAVLLTRHRGSLRSGFVSTCTQAWEHARQLVRQRARVASAAAASALTTIMMSVGFVVAVNMWGQATHPMAAGALVAVYLFASAAGGAIPLPPVFGLTEVTLVAALVLGGYTSSSALVAVIIFRAVSYWLPLPVGVWAAHRLRRAQLL
jgi:uncharacterized membrane protein YbhN (UPF0104 family)